MDIVRTDTENGQDIRYGSGTTNGLEEVEQGERDVEDCEDDRSGLRFDLVYLCVVDVYAGWEDSGHDDNRGRGGEAVNELGRREGRGGGRKEGEEETEGAFFLALYEMRQAWAS